MKKFKFALLALLLVPCLFLASCTKGISMTDYSAKVKVAAEKFYSSFGEKSMTVESKSNSTQTWKQKVSYGEADEYSQENFKAVTEKTQKIEVSIANSNDSTNRTLKITETSTTTTTGKKENDAKNGLKDSKSVKKVDKVIIICLANDSYRAYITTTTHENDSEAKVENEYFDFASENDYFEWLAEFADECDSELMEDMFFSPSILIFSIGGKLEAYSAGKDVFGQKGSMTNTQVKDKVITSTTMSFDMQFKDSLPSRIEVNSNLTTKDDHVSEADMLINMCVKENQVVSIGYYCGAIEAPSSFDIETATPLSMMPEVTIDFEGINF